MPAVALQPPDLSRVVLEFEPKLKAKYLRLESNSVQPTAEKSESLLDKTAVLLEFLLVGGYLYEVLDQCGWTPQAIPAESADFIRQRTLAMYGLDPVAVVAAVLPHLDPGLARAPIFLSLEAVVRALSAGLESCPIHRLEQLAASQGFETLGHRCRVAYDAIRAFLQRNDPRQKAQLSVIGPHYVDGALSISDASTLLNMHPVDVVALLESEGYRRNLDQIRLDAATRNDLYAQIREDRLRRGGKPMPTRESTARNVVASERIEGVDARRWITRDA